ncbi:MAG: hypothetical protein WC319_03235 [Candidatus Paceibacterota bacterium]|jgi:hypothetical protein
MTKITSEITQKIKHYLEVIEKMVYPDQHERNNTLADMGLIIFEPNSQVNALDVQSILPEGKSVLYKMDNFYDYETFVSKLIEANKSNQWLIVDCLDDFSPTTIGIIKQIGEMNKFTVLNFRNENSFQLKINPETRIIFCINSDFLEEKISYPYFLNIFGAILRI